MCAHALGPWNTLSPMNNVSNDADSAHGPTFRQPGPILIHALDVFPLRRVFSSTWSRAYACIRATPSQDFGLRNRPVCNCCRVTSCSAIVSRRETDSSRLHCPTEHADDACFPGTFADLRICRNLWIPRLSALHSNSQTRSNSLSSGSFWIYVATVSKWEYLHLVTFCYG